MTSSADRKRALERLLSRTPDKRIPDAARVVDEFRSQIRRAMRRGHSLETLATELRLPKRTLQRHLNLAGLFFRKPRKNHGVVIRPYKKRKTAA